MSSAAVLTGALRVKVYGYAARFFAIFARLLSWMTKSFKKGVYIYELGIVVVVLSCPR